MSLLLRRDCQAILDEFQLSKYHVVICEHIKHLKIVGECGKTLVDISGIKFAKVSPSKAEIEYATELLEEFLDQHISIIKNYVDLASVFKKKPEVTTKFGNFGINSVTRSGSNPNSYYCYYTDNIFHIIYYADTKELGITIKSDIKPAPNQLTEYQFNHNHLKAAKAYLKTYIKYEEERLSIEEVKDALSICNI